MTACIDRDGRLALETTTESVGALTDSLLARIIH
jgi:hypothetical protein